MAQLLKFLAALAAASALVVRDGAELRTALANGAPAIELAADAYLGGEVAIVASASFHRPWPGLLVSYRPLAYGSVRGPYYLGVGSISDSLSR